MMRAVPAQQAAGQRQVYYSVRRYAMRDREDRSGKLIICFITAVLMFMILSPAKTEAAAKLTNMPFPSLYQKSIVRQSYSGIDITGDRKADRVTVIVSNTNGDSSFMNKIRIGVNGKEVWTWASSRYSFGEGFTLKLCTLQNGKPYLFVKGEDVNLSAAVCLLLRYINGRMKVIYNFRSGIVDYGYHGAPSAVSGNTIIYDTYCDTPATGTLGVRFRFDYKNGALKLRSRIGNVIPFFGTKYPSRYYTLIKDVKYYKSQTSKKAVGQFRKGTKVRVLKVYKTSQKSARIKLLSKSGRIRWVNGANYFRQGATKRPIIKEFSYGG